MRAPPMTRHRSMVTRRTALYLAPAGIAAVGTMGIPLAVNGSTLSRSMHNAGVPMPVAERISVAAVQMGAGESNVGPCVRRMVKAVADAKLHDKNIRLVAFPKNVIRLLHMSSGAYGTLIQCAHAFETVLTFGADVYFDESGIRHRNVSLLLEPDGSINVADRSKPLVKDTVAGTLAQLSGSPEPKHKQEMIDAGVDILIQLLSGDDSLSPRQDQSERTGFYSVEVTEAKPFLAPRSPTTTIFDRNGRAMTTAGSKWNQIIIAALPNRPKPALSV